MLRFRLVIAKKDRVWRLKAQLQLFEICIVINVGYSTVQYSTVQQETFGDNHDKCGVSCYSLLELRERDNIENVLYRVSSNCRWAEN